MSLHFVLPFANYDQGCACRFLYGRDTDEEKRALIDRALQDKAELKAEVKFYTKLGEEFLHI